MTRLLLLLCLLMGLWPDGAGATIFFDDDFESGTLVSNGWTTGSCNPADPNWAINYPEGCNPAREVGPSHSGTHSLHGSYFPSPCPGGDQTGSCGASAKRIHTATRNIYTRHWEKTVGFTFNSIGGGTKEFYTRSEFDSTLPFIFYVYIPDGSSPFRPPLVSQMITSAPTVCGSDGILKRGCNLYQNMATVRPVENQWTCIRTHTNQGTEGHADGTHEMWVGDTQTHGYYNQPFRLVGDRAYTQIEIYTQLGNGDKYIDDFAADDQPILCGAGSGTPLDTTAPTAVTSASGVKNPTNPSTQGDLTWTNGADDVRVEGQNIKRCIVVTGTTCVPTTILTTLNGINTTYTDTTLSGGQKAGYSINDFDAAGNQGAYSSVFYLTTDVSVVDYQVGCVNTAAAALSTTITCQVTGTLVTGALVGIGFTYASYTHLPVTPVVCTDTNNPTGYVTEATQYAEPAGEMVLGACYKINATGGVNPTFTVAFPSAKDYRGIAVVVYSGSAVSSVTRDSAIGRLDRKSVV